jgi:hypothetical protein
MILEIHDLQVFGTILKFKFEPLTSKYNLST